jgi:hypothetical protein
VKKKKLIRSSEIAEKALKRLASQVHRRKKLGWRSDAGRDPKGTRGGASGSGGHKDRNPSPSP